MDILNTLKLDQTVFIQLSLFFFVYIILSKFLFKPYLAIFLKRAELTNVSEATASQLVAQTKDLSLQFEMKAREVNDKITQVFQQQKLEAQIQYDKIVQQAQATAEARLEKARKLRDTAVIEAQKQLVHELPQVSVAITQTLLGKGATQ